MRVPSDWVIVLRTQARTKTEGGIELPDASRKAFQHGLVLGAGPKVTTIRVGDVVQFDVAAARDILFEPSGRKPFVLTAVIEEGTYVAFTADEAADMGLSLPTDDELAGLPEQLLSQLRAAAA